MNSLPPNPVTGNGKATAPPFTPLPPPVTPDDPPAEADEPLGPEPEARASTAEPAPDDAAPSATPFVGQGGPLLRKHKKTAVALATSSEKQNIERAIKAVVKFPQLWPLFGIAHGGRSIFGEQPSVAEAFAAAGCTVEACVWEAATVAYQAFSAPSRENVQYSLQHLEFGYFGSTPPRAEIDDFVESLYGAMDLTLEAARALVKEVLKRQLFYKPMKAACAAAAGDWLAENAWKRAEALRDEIDSILQGVEAEGPFSLEDFRQRADELKELVKGVLVAGQPGLLGGPSKSQKTLLTLDMCVSVATGTPFLDHFPCPQPRRVALYSGESGAATITRKVDVITEAKKRLLLGNEHARFDRLLEENVFLDDRLPDLGDPSALKRLGKIIEDKAISLVIVDPLLLALGAAAKDLANSAVIGELIMKANRAVTEAGGTLLLVHHTAGDRFRRQAGGSRGPLQLCDLAYPGITNFVRQWVTVNRASEYDAATRRSELWLNIGGSGLQTGGVFHATIDEGHGHDRWDVLVRPEAQQHDHEREARDRQRQRNESDTDRRILEFLRANPDASIRQMCRDNDMLQGIGDAGIRAGLNRLQSHGAVTSADHAGCARWSAVHSGNDRDA